MTPNGYGLIYAYGPGAHRIAYELFKGTIPHSYDIAHRCNARSCVNPSHLEAVPHWRNPPGDSRRCPLPLMSLNYPELAERLKGTEEDIRFIFNGLWKERKHCWICGGRGRYRYKHCLLLACGVCHRFIRSKGWEVLNIRHWDAIAMNKRVCRWSHHRGHTRADIRREFDNGAFWPLGKDPWLQFK